MKKIVLLTFLLSCNAVASEPSCDKAIIEQFIKARELYLSIKSISSEGYQNPRIALWKSDVEELSQRCGFSSIDLPFDRSVVAHDLLDLMGAYIFGKGIEEWQAKFSLALVCHENPEACSKYINKESSKELEGFMDMTN